MGFNTETMTIHKALSELKVLRARISKDCNELRPVAVSRANRTTAAEQAKFAEDAKSAIISMCDKISRFNAIKSGIVLSNATTNVVVGGKTVTVAEAIEMKANYMAFLRNLNITLSSSYASCIGEKTKIENEIENSASRIFGSSQTASDAKTDLMAMYNGYISANAPQLIEAIDTKKATARLTEIIDAFASDIDSALSVSNATTEISVTYEIGKTPVEF